MELSILLARMLSIYFIIVGVALLMHRAYYQGTMNAYLKNDPLFLLSNILALITGIILVTLHNIWFPAWPVIITIIGWLSLVKGAFRLLFPTVGAGWRKRIINHDPFYFICAAITLVIGIVLAYYGYFVGIHIV